VEDLKNLALKESLGRKPHNRQLCSILPQNLQKTIPSHDLKTRRSRKNLLFQLIRWKIEVFLGYIFMGFFTLKHFCSEQTTIYIFV